MYHPAYYEPLSTWAFQCSSDCSISITVYCDGTRPGDPMPYGPDLPYTRSLTVQVHFFDFGTSLQDSLTVTCAP